MLKKPGDTPLSALAFIIAFVFWFIESSIHHFVFGEQQFEFIPDDFNELWMRAIIVLLIILFGIYADYSTKRLLIKERKLEATRIYNVICSPSGNYESILN